MWLVQQLIGLIPHLPCTSYRKKGLVQENCDFGFIILIGNSVGNLSNLLILMRKRTRKFKSPVWRVDFKIYSPGSICSRQWQLGNHFSGALVLTQSIDASKKINNTIRVPNTQKEVAKRIKAKRSRSIFLVINLSTIWIRNRSLFSKLN